MFEFEILILKRNPVVDFKIVHYLPNLSINIIAIISISLCNTSMWDIQSHQIGHIVAIKPFVIITFAWFLLISYLEIHKLPIKNKISDNRSKLAVHPSPSYSDILNILWESLTQPSLIFESTCLSNAYLPTFCSYKKLVLSMSIYFGILLIHDFKFRWVCPSRAEYTHLKKLNVQVHRLKKTKSICCLLGYLPTSQN